MTAAKFNVGDPVIVTSVNRDRGYAGTVAKVGRKLVTVRSERWGQEDAFRIDTGMKNDAYQHERVWTLAEHEDNAARTQAISRINGNGLRFDALHDRSLSTESLNRLADFLDELIGGES